MPAEKIGRLLKNPKKRKFSWFVIVFVAYPSLHDFIIISSYSDILPVFLISVLVFCHHKAHHELCLAKTIQPNSETLGPVVYTASASTHHVVWRMPLPGVKNSLFFRRCGACQNDMLKMLGIQIKTSNMLKTGSVRLAAWKQNAIRNSDQSTTRLSPQNNIFLTTLLYHAKKLATKLSLLNAHLQHLRMAPRWVSAFSPQSQKMANTRNVIFWAVSNPTHVLFQAELHTIENDTGDHGRSHTQPAAAKALAALHDRSDSED